jgi:hypothetical protein
MMNHSSKIATARVQPAEAPRIFIEKHATPSRRGIIPQIRKPDADFTKF